MASAVSTASAGKLEPAWPTFRPAKPDPVLGNFGLQGCIAGRIYRVSQKDANNDLNLLCNNESYINGNINFKYVSNLSSLMGNPVSLMGSIHLVYLIRLNKSTFLAS